MPPLRLGGRGLPFGLSPAACWEPFFAGLRHALGLLEKPVNLKKKPSFQKRLTPPTPTPKGGAFAAALGRAPAEGVVRGDGPGTSVLRGAVAGELEDGVVEVGGWGMLLRRRQGPPAKKKMNRK